MILEIGQPETYPDAILSIDRSLYESLWEEKKNGNKNWKHSEDYIKLATILRTVFDCQLIKAYHVGRYINIENIRKNGLRILNLEKQLEQIEFDLSPLISREILEEIKLNLATFLNSHERETRIGQLCCFFRKDELYDKSLIGWGYSKFGAYYGGESLEWSNEGIIHKLCGIGTAYAIGFALTGLEIDKDNHSFVYEFFIDDFILIEIERVLNLDCGTTPGFCANLRVSISADRLTEITELPDEWYEDIYKNNQNEYSI